MDDQISSTTEDQKYLQQTGKKLATGEFTEEEVSEFSDCKNFNLDEILDLAGGAKDAIERHRSENQSTMDIKPVKFINPLPEKEKTQAEVKAPTSQLWNLLYWRDVQKTAWVFGGTLSLLISLSLLSIISVCSYIALTLLSVTICFRVYRGITDALQKSENTHPFRSYLAQDVTLSPDIIHKHSDQLLKYINATIKELKHFFLVEDLIDSLKLAVLLWVLTHVGSLFNGLTLLIIGEVAAFTCPVLYEKYQTQIDHYFGLVKSYLQDIVKKLHQGILIGFGIASLWAIPPDTLINLIILPPPPLHP
ncbi:Reticulon-4 [Bagarius yarrelli]|uniref:Reticulon n=1 Tax=Bagarius yarrelli TaxID=175774 RepID=A0A556TXZ6_BAGYA|nr:Reticulon-4 [Bagarius yarrelli]